VSDETIRYETLRSPGELEAVAAEWDELARSMQRPSPFMSTAWLVPWWHHHGVEREMRVEVARVGDRLVGGLPLEIERRRFGLRVAHVMGRHHAALGGVVVSRELENVVTEGLLERIGGGGVDYADFFGLTSASPLTACLAGRAALYERVESPVLDISRGWDTVYREKTSSKRRNLHGRRRKQLDALGGLELTIALTEPDLAKEIEEAFRLHNLRWAGRNDGSEFTTPVGRRFNTEAVRTLGAAGVARILTLRVGGHAVAFHYYLIFAGRMYVYRLAFDPEIARYSPGLVATLAAIEAASHEGVKVVEYCGGGEPYKLDLSDGPDPMYQCVGFAQSLKGRIGARGARVVLSTGLRVKRSPKLTSAYVRLRNSVGSRAALSE
jgi:CelD/BcsL family acetyltransferase involved in cellulose biosynthesis